MAKNPMYHALRNKVEETDNPNTKAGFAASLVSLTLIFAAICIPAWLFFGNRDAIWWVLGYFAVGQFVLPFTNFRFSARKDLFDLRGHLRQNVLVMLWPYFVVRPEKDELPEKDESQ